MDGCTICSLRYGLGEGFSNEKKSRVQKAAVKFQQNTYVSLHENVPAYQQDPNSGLIVKKSDPFFMQRCL